MDELILMAIQSKPNLKQSLKTGVQSLLDDVGPIKERNTTKEVAGWKVSDVIYYITESHRKKYGGLAPVYSGPALQRKAISDIEKGIEAQTGKIPTKVELKKYIDWFFAIHLDRVHDIIKTKQAKGFYITEMVKPGYIMEYLKPQKTEVQMTQVFTSVKADVTLKTEIESAYEVGASCLLTTFGLILPVNYLIRFQGKSTNEAYTEWLPFTDLKKIVKELYNAEPKQPLLLGYNIKLEFLK